jgi:hypothetical protein
MLRSPLATLTFEPGSKLREIESDAFYGCGQLRRISIPPSVTKMTWGSFPESNDFQIELEKGNEYFEMREDFLVDFRRHHVVRYFGSGSELVISDEIEEIGERCFRSCQTICFVRFGSMSRLSSIGASAFANCLFLIRINIPSTVTSLGPSCFSRCLSLQTVSFCSGSLLNSIPKHGFSSCECLQSIVLPPSVKILDDCCFLRCVKLVDSPLPLESEVVRIGPCAFGCCSSLTSMVLPSTLEYVGAWCFRNCNSLHGLTFSSPSKLRELLTLPPALFGFVPIPASVEVLAVSPLWRRGEERGLTFGDDSRLAKITREQDYRQHPPGHVTVYAAFLQVSARSLKLFRQNLEFEIPN